MTDYLVLRLRARHATLENDIANEHRAPMPDAVRLAELKKEKLQIRDKLHWILRGDDGEALRARA